MVSQNSHEPQRSRGLNLSTALENIWGSHSSEGQAKALTETSVTHWTVEGVVIHIEVGRIHRPTKLRDVGGCAGCQSLPVNPFKERVLPEVVQSTTAQPLLLTAQQLSDEVLGTSRHIRYIGGELKVILWVKGGCRSGWKPNWPGIICNHTMWRSQGHTSDLVVHDLAVGFYQRFCIKGCFSKEQLIGADSQ